ncbi:hypothetical protein AOCH_003005 [Aspergillus ochraceoroseus]|uniref:Siderophore iron transporter n=1 Tax=Aspergillus ochraceoroseus TaxID=138278 RepID=A0A0F8WV38_9EURO|nr:hypothetical protein AOCH_003005 [Aspergillus ochraceoroseus]
MASLDSSHIGAQSTPYISQPDDEDWDWFSDDRNHNEPTNVVLDDDDESAPAWEPQLGVQDIEAVTVAWTTGALGFVYIIIWLTYFAEGILSATTGILAPYVTSDFALHSLTPTVGILSSVIGGVTNLTLAKVLDVFGRPQGYLFCILLATIGLGMMTVCNSVQAYAAAQVLQTVGNNGILYSRRQFSESDYMLVGRPNILEVFERTWLAVGVWHVYDSCAGHYLPLFNTLLRNYLQARKLGLVPKTNGDADLTASESLLYYCRQFDAVGLVLLSTGVALFLLPFNVYALPGWNLPLAIGILITGSMLISGFVMWERRYAAITFIPYSLLLDRTVLGSCLLAATLFTSFWCWNSFFGSYLQVVNGLSVESASYVVQLYTVCSVVCSIAVGALIHYAGRFKPVCLYVGIPLSGVGSGLMMCFSKMESSVGYIIMCQVFISIAAGIIMVCDEVAILAAASDHHAAVCLAVLGMFSNIGSAIGLTVASAIWQEVFPKSLMQYLPPAELANLREIYANLSTQLSYSLGSETRIAIQHAYADAQMRMLAVGTTVWIAGFMGVIIWRDINVIGLQQNKGHV